MMMMNIERERRAKAAQHLPGPNVPKPLDLKLSSWTRLRGPMQNVRSAGSFLARIYSFTNCIKRVKDQKVGEGTYAVVYRG